MIKKYYIEDVDSQELIDYYDTLEEAQEALEALITDGIADHEHHFVNPYEIRECDEQISESDAFDLSTCHK